MACIPTQAANSPDDTAARLAHEQRRREGIDRWRASGVPKRHREVVEAGLNAESWQDAAGVSRAIQVVKANGLLALLGPWGTGKTQLAAWLCYGVCLRGRPALYRRWADLIAEIRAEAYGDGGSDARAMYPFKTAGLLVIDELHERRWTEDENLWLGRIIEHRYGEKVPTVLVANLNPVELKNTLSPAVIDRMRQEGAVVELVGPSRRVAPTRPTP